MGNLDWAMPAPLGKKSEVRLIRGSPNGVHHARPQSCCPGRHGPEQVVVIDWKWWSPSTGFTGRHAPERAEFNPQSFSAALSSR
jgi:hypothetical protein